MPEPVEVVLAKPRGFCAGVDRAIAIVERALEVHGAPIYVRHEIVHNKFVVEDLRAKGAVFVEELSEVPVGGTVIFSAHGVSLAVRREAEERGLRVFDATCPLVTKVHAEVARMREQGREVVMIGHEGHPEAEGTMGQSDTGMYLVESEEDVARLEVKDPANLAYVTQTTLSMDDAARIVAALRARFPAILGPEEGRHLLRHAEPPGRGEVHGAALRRGDRRGLAQQLQLEPAARGGARTSGARAFLVDRAEEIRAEWIAEARTIGVTAGASAPEVLVQDVIACLQRMGAVRVRELEGITESVTFPLPRSIARRGQRPPRLPAPSAASGTLRGRLEGGLRLRLGPRRGAQPHALRLAGRRRPSIRNPALHFRTQ